MDIKKFWNIVEKADLSSGIGLGDGFDDFRNELKSLTSDEIILWHHMFVAYLNELVSDKRIWAATEIINDKTTLGEVQEFSEWVILKGEDFYMTAVKDTDGLVDKLTVVDFKGVGRLYAESDSVEYIVMSEFSESKGLITDTDAQITKAIDEFYRDKSRVEWPSGLREELEQGTASDLALKIKYEDDLDFSIRGLKEKLNLQEMLPRLYGAFM